MIKLTLLLSLALSWALFATQNTAPVKLHFLRWQSQDISLSLIITISAAVGAALTFLAMIPWHRRHRRRIAEKDRELDRLREEGKL